MVGLSSVERLPQHLLVTVEAYPQNIPNNVTDRRLSTINGIEGRMHLVDAQGRRLGRPAETVYDRLSSVDGLIVTLAYKKLPHSKYKPTQLVVEPSALFNHKPIVLAVPSERDTRMVRRSDLDEIVSLAQTPTPDSSPPTVIDCQRQGLQLKVPVVLNIHGVKVRTIMLLDTGASLTVVAASVYQQGLAKPLDSLRRIQVKTANGIITCPVDKIAVSTTAYTKELFVALTNDATSLLGADYFSGRRFTVDLQNKRIIVDPEQL